MKGLGRMGRSRSQRLAERVQRLVAGDSPADVGDLGYAFDAWHLGMIVKGGEAEAGVRALAAGLDCQALVVPRGNGIVWAWLGARPPLAGPDVERLLSSDATRSASLAGGGPRSGAHRWGPPPPEGPRAPEGRHLQTRRRAPA